MAGWWLGQAGIHRVLFNVEQHCGKAFDVGRDRVVEGDWHGSDATDGSRATYGLPRPKSKAPRRAGAVRPKQSLDRRED